MMEISFGTLNFLVGLGAVLLEVLAVLLFVALYFRSRNSVASRASDFTGEWGLLMGFLVTLVALGVSLYYSEILDFAPCGLCWLMRVFMYSQIFIFGTAFVKKDRHIADYIIVLSVAGLLIGLYQHYLQMGGSDILPCPATPEASDCAIRILFEFGHVTFPWVGVSMFAFLIAIALHMRPKKSK